MNRLSSRRQRADLDVQTEENRVDDGISCTGSDLVPNDEARLGFDLTRSRFVLRRQSEAEANDARQGLPPLAVVEALGTQDTYCELRREHWNPGSVGAEIPRLQDEQSSIVE